MHPEDNSALLTTADEIRAYEYQRGRASRDEEVAAMVGDLAYLRSEMEANEATYLALRAEYAAHMATHQPDPEPAPAVKIGASFAANETLPAAVTSIDVARFFFGPDKMRTTQTWDRQAKLVKAHDTYGARTFSISFKPDAGATADRPFTNPGNIERFLDTIPADVEAADVLLTFYHEHNGNLRDGSLSLALYRAGSKVVADIAHNRGHLYGPIHNGNVRQNITTGPWGLWPEVWAQMEADTSLYDFWGVDCYSTNYEPPSPRMDPIRTYADSLGLPVLIGELGAPNGPQQAAWCRDARTWALGNTRWACYWSSQISGETNYRLTDDAAREWFGL